MCRFAALDAGVLRSHRHSPHSAVKSLGNYPLHGAAWLSRNKLTIELNCDRQSVDSIVFFL